MKIKIILKLSGRGELQLGVLVETMRREGFELTVSRPHVIFKTDANGNKTEPMEEVTIDLNAEFSSKIIDNMNKRKAEMINMIDVGAGKKRLIFHAPVPWFDWLPVKIYDANAWYWGNE